MKVSDILRVKGHVLFTVPPEARLLQAVQTMAQHDIGSLVVMAHGKLVGLLTFSEVMAAVAEGEGVLGDQLVPMAQFTAEAGYNHPLISDRGRNISLFAGLAGVAGYETTNWGDKHLRDGATLRSDDSIIYGGRLSASLEGYLSNRVIVLLNLREYCTFGSSTGTFHTTWGIGFRFIIN